MNIDDFLVDQRRRLDDIAAREKNDLFTQREAAMLAMLESGKAVPRARIMKRLGVKRDVFTIFMRRMRERHKIDTVQRGRCKVEYQLRTPA